MSMMGNVLAIGSEGVGKSTLIRAVLGSNAQVTQEGARYQLRIYEEPSCPFRVFDAGDLGKNLIARHHAISAMRRWSKDHAADGNDDNDDNDEEYFTETLARIYIRQGRYQKALDIISRLSSKYPQKNAYFADQIRFLEKLIINNNTKLNN